MASDLLDQHDQELMSGLQALGPLLLGPRKWMAENDEDRHTKRHKAVKVEDGSPELADMVRLMAQIVLNHEKSIQHYHRQDCFVMFAQTDPQGAMPLLLDLTNSWKCLPEPQPAQQKTTLRTFLMAGPLKELHKRARQIANSKPGEELWDTAVRKGTIQADGSWMYQRWAPDSQQLVTAAKAPLPMPRMLKLLETMETLLQDNSHIVRFHSLRHQAHVVPWMLQVTLRDCELWTLLNQTTQCTIWSLLGMTVKQHHQQLTKPAQMLTDLLGLKGSSQKGQGKGKSKTKAKKSG